MSLAPLGGSPNRFYTGTEHSPGVLEYDCLGDMPTCALALVTVGDRPASLLTRDSIESLSAGALAFVTV
jgi:hypothetical protein